MTTTTQPSPLKRPTSCIAICISTENSNLKDNIEGTMASTSKKIVIIGDSLGMERTGDLGDIHYNVTWPVLLQKFLSKDDETNTAVGSLCLRARTMDTVPDAVTEAAIFGADTLLIQVGIVDCFPRISSREDRELLEKLRPSLRDCIRKYFREQRHTVLSEAGSVVYTTKEHFTKYAQQAAILAQRYGINIIFLSIIAHPDLEGGTPGLLQNAADYNEALKSVCAQIDCADYYDLSELAADKSLLHDDLYHISPAGNAKLALLMHDHLSSHASPPLNEQNEGKKLQSFVTARSEIMKVLSEVLFKAGHSSSAAETSQAADQMRVHYPNRTVQQAPTSAFIEITNYCNLNCTMCNTQLSNRQKGYMSPELFAQVIIRLQSLGIHRAALHTVGETLLHPRLDTLLSIARQRNFSVFFSTNGQLTSKLKHVLPLYSESFNSIRFSIDAATPETYAKIRRGGTIEKVWQSLQAINDFNACNSTSFEIVTNYILSETNKDEIDLFIDKATEFTPINNIKFNLPNSLSPDPSFLKEIFPFHNLIYPTGYGCTLPFGTIAITFDGKMSLCCRDYNADLVIGSFIEGNPLQAWRNKRAESIRNGVHGIGVCPELCKKCHNVSGSELCSTFIHKAHLLGLRDIGARLWHLFSAISQHANDISRIRKECFSVLS